MRSCPLCGEFSNLSVCPECGYSIGWDKGENVVTPSCELREDGGLELREDGGIEERE